MIAVIEKYIYIYIIYSRIYSSRCEKIIAMNMKHLLSSVFYKKAFNLT